MTATLEPKFVALAASPDPSTVSSAISADSTVSGDGSTGDVQFSDADGPLSCSGGDGISGLVATEAGAASCVVQSVGIGVDQITASYLGSSTLAPSASGLAVTVTAAEDATVTAVTASADPAGGSAPTYTATVTAEGAAQVPTGSVAFSAAGSTISGCALVSLSEASSDSSTATCTPSSAPASAVDVSAEYAGDADDLASEGQLTEQVGEVVVPEVAITPSADPVPAGTEVDYTVTVTGTGARPAAR